MSSWQDFLQEHFSAADESSKRFKSLTSSISKALEDLEYSINTLGGLDELVAWYDHESPEDPFSDIDRIGFKLTQAKEWALLVGFGKKGQTRKTEMVGDWRRLIQSPVETKSQAIAYLPRFLRRIQKHLDDKCATLSARLDAIAIASDTEKGGK